MSIIPRKRLNLDTIRRTLNQLAALKKGAPDEFKAKMDKEAWLILASMISHLNELERNLLRVQKLKDEADKVIEKLRNSKKL